jgi:hypothetical protein
VTDTSPRRPPDTVARTARQFHANDTIERAARGITRRIRWAEYRDDRRPDRDRQMHRAGIAGDQQIVSLDQTGKRQQFDVPGHVDDP